MLWINLSCQKEWLSMLPGRRGAFRLFRLAGINVYLHWTWFVVAIYQVQADRGRPFAEYEPQYQLLWRAAEYVMLFAIVLTHEFGHALACRQVGGMANQIILWPLGGVAFVSPPPRPGAMLWSIAAGPLVNLVLAPITIGLSLISHFSLGWGAELPNVDAFLTNIALINGVLLIFNILPIYPLDGGQIVQSLLWFVVGRATSLMVASTLGMIGGFCFVVYGLLLLALSGNPLPLLLAAFVAFLSWRGFQQGRALMKLEQAPRYRELACPKCSAAPLKGEFWGCAECGTRFDTFLEGGICPGCGREFHKVQCLECGQAFPHNEWFPAAIEMGESV
jgi:Zn-dependent protease